MRQDYNRGCKLTFGVQTDAIPRWDSIRSFQGKLTFSVQTDAIPFRDSIRSFQWFCNSLFVLVFFNIEVFIMATLKQEAITEIEYSELTK
jgi:hypothetical protein